MTDLLIADVSSVTLDHLYLAPESPIILTDRRTNRDLLALDSPVASAADVVDQSSLKDIGVMIATNLSADTKRDERANMRDYYFGDLAPGSSTERFWQQMDTAIREHDRALQGLQRLRTVTE